MSQTQKVASSADRSIKALIAAQTALQKVVADLNNNVEATAVVVDAIQQKEAELATLQSQFDLKFAEYSQALRIRVLDNENQVLSDLLKFHGLARISGADLSALEKQLQAALQDNAAAVESAVQAKASQLYSTHASEVKELKATHAVESAATAATVQSQATQISFLQAEVERLRKDIESERTTRLQIAQADAGRQGVVVNAGK